MEAAGGKPCALVAVLVKLPMVERAEEDVELARDLSSERVGLRRPKGADPKVMRVGGTPLLPFAVS
jgi:hypothetical protein